MKQHSEETKVDGSINISEQDIAKLEKFLEILNISLEAAHIYIGKQPSEEEVKYAINSAKFISSLSNKKLSNTLFIDDIPSHNPEGKKVNINQYIAYLESLGFKLDEVYYESDLIKPSLELILKKLKDNFVVESKNTEKYLGVNGILLVKKDGEPACNLLDATLYHKKLHIGSNMFYDFAKKEIYWEETGTITVLPSEYKEQQKKVMKVLGSLFVDLSKICNVYYSKCQECPSSPLNLEVITYVRQSP